VAAEQSSWEFEAGAPITPRLHALRFLGGGIRYEAYLAWDDRLYSTSVVKIVRPDRVKERSTLEGLAEEAGALAALSHPVLPRAFDAVLVGERPHIVLEHLEGPRLSTLVRRYGPVAAEQLSPLAIHVSAALHYMHGAGWVHLDVKPSNIVMGAPPRLIDLSVAKRLEQLEGISQAIGTDAYMAPEQCLPAELGPPGPAADVFGLGVTLFRALTGHRPFSSPSEEETAPPDERWPQLKEDPEVLESEDMGPEAAAAINAALSREPGERPAAAEMARAFERTLSTLPEPRIGRLKPRPRRR
jgi:serine/threonine protein kinase